MNEQVNRKVNPRDYLRRFLINNVRPDGRAPNTPRKINITTGSIHTAVGSAMVKFGRTTAVAGIHATLVEPAQTSPEDGIFDIFVEVLPTATVPGQSRGYRGADEAVALTHYLHAWIAPYFPADQLCVDKGRLVWRLRLTVYIVDHDGNLEDAAALAAVAAIRDVRLPAVRMLDDNAGANSGDDGGGDDENAAMLLDSDDPQSANQSTGLDSTVIAEATEERTVALQVDNLPLVVSFSLFEAHALLDPSAEEEMVADSRLTMVFRPNGDLRGVDKSGGKYLSEEHLNACIEIAQHRASVLVDKLKQPKLAKS